VANFLALQQPTGRVPLALAPDGALLAISVQPKGHDTTPDADKRFTAAGVPMEAVGSRVLIVDTVTGEAAAPFPPASTSWGGRWSSDGAWLAAYVQHEGPACLGLWRRGMDAVRLVREAQVRPFFGFEVPRWTPDSASAVIKLVPSGGPARAEQSTAAGPAPVTVLSHDPALRPETPALPGFSEVYRCGLAAVDVHSGAVRRLASDWSLSGWEVAPDGHAVAVLRDTGFDQTRQQSYFDLVVLCLSTGEATTIATRIAQEYGVGISWSPDSTQLAYFTAERGQPGRAFTVAASGVCTPVALSPEDGPTLARAYDAPRWRADSQEVFCLTDAGVWAFTTDGVARRFLPGPAGSDLLGWALPPGDQTPVRPENGDLPVVLRDRATKDTALARLDWPRGQCPKVASVPRGWEERPFGVTMAADGSTVYLLLEAASHPAEVWQCALASRDFRRVWSFNPHLDDVAFGRARLVAYRTLDGARRQAALLLPPGYEEEQHVPVIVDIYGGRLGSTRLHRFGGDEGVINGQLLASQGYAVLYPDVPLSDCDPLRQLPGLVLPALDALLERGIADPDRLGLMGQSHGGYCTLALLTQIARFKAAVAVAGMTNLTSFYGILSPRGDNPWLGWSESGQGRLGGSLWEQRAAYIENSPLFYFDRVETPLLLVSGTASPGEAAQAGEAYSALRRLGKRVELRLYDGEDHWPGFWAAANYRDFAERVVSWFGEHLAAPAASAPHDISPL
jgi:dipeptidyl aminopeptidase/acylaminoacyl peptidase